ncbi:MAG: hypothetical protein BWY95_02243 [Bacteroidetes bacterium ADurb.BinA104]|nr:MAG: hypothetical protein BWY95_02243 [Bacteroidetes bacterium ADurb.BinA104]
MNTISADGTLGIGIEAFKQHPYEVICERPVVDVKEEVAFRYHKP